MSQPEFAGWVNVTKKTLFSWESGKTAPDCFQLAAFATAGVDVLFVLTGVALDAHARLAVLQATIERVHQEGGDLDAVRATARAADDAEAAIRAAQTADRKGFLSLARAWPGLSPANRQAILSLAQAASHSPPASMLNTGANAVQVGHAGGDVTVGQAATKQPRKR